MLREDYDELHQMMHQLETHNVFEKVNSMEALRTFMEWHVFAVWDFMSLVKRLQRELTCVDIPWIPPRDAQAARLINDIVLGEESDEDGSGGHQSHFDLYLCAMHEVGADTSRIDKFVEYLRAGDSATHALSMVKAEPAVTQFVQSTLNMACDRMLPEVLGSFLFGRESVIPAMFRRLLADGCVDVAEAPTFVYYLERHINLDGDSHGPAAERILARLIQANPWQRPLVVNAAVGAVKQRIALWDALSQKLS